MKISTCFLFIVLFTISNFSSSAQIMFQKELPLCNLYEIKQTADGGYITAGWGWPGGNGLQRCALIKTDSFGDTLWTKWYGESEDVVSYSVDINSDGGYILAGYTYDTGVMGAKVYLIRTDSNGDTLWTKKYGGVGGESARDIRRTFDGGFIISGSSNSFGLGSAEMYVIKTDSSGLLEWSRTFSGGTNDVAYAICQTADSGYAAVGVLSAFANNCDIILIKMNALGDTLWTKSFGGPGQDFAFNIEQTLNNGLAIAGYTYSFNSGDAYILVTDSMGNLLWSRTYGASGFIHAHDITPTTDGGYVVSGYTNSFGVATWAPIVFKINSVGNPLWAKTYADFQYGTAFTIIQTADGGYATAGEEYEIMKLSPDGSALCFEQSVTLSITNLLLGPLNKPIVVTVPNTITYETITSVSGGIEVVNICTNVSIDDDQTIKSSFTVFPNPVRDEFSIEFNAYSGKNITMELFSADGRLIQTLINNKFSSGDFKETFDVRNLQSGIYFVKVKGDVNGVQRIIKL